MNNVNVEEDSLNNLDKLYDNSIEKNKLLKIDIDNYYKKTNTDERKVYYEIEEISNIKFYNKFIKFIYLVIFIYFLYKISDNFKILFNPFYLFLIILYIIFPFMIRHIIIFIYSFMNINSKIDNINNNSLSTCNISNINLDDINDNDNDNTTPVVEPELLIPKCYIRLEGGKCKNKKESEWTGWKHINFFSDCSDCNDDTQEGCDSIKNKWSNYCGNNVFNIFTPSSPESKNILPSIDTCVSK